MSRFRNVCRFSSFLIAITILGGLYVIKYSGKETFAEKEADKLVKDGEKITFKTEDISLLSKTFPIEKSLQMVKDRTLADKLAKEIRIICWIAVTDTSLDRVAMINETWGKRCTKILFMGDESTKGKDSIISLDIRNGRNQLWPKTKEAFKYIAKNYFDKADWILKADTDTYVIMENLRYLLYLQDPTKPHYLGCHIKLFTKKGYNSGGAGYAINNIALKKLITEGFENTRCRKGYQEDEDVSMGYCMGLIGVPPGDSTDESEKNRFFPFEPYDHVSPDKIGNNKWYWLSSHKPGKKTLDCCSETVAAFHYVPVNVFWTMEYLLYHTQLYGVTHTLT